MKDEHKYGKKWPEMVVKRSFIKGHSFRISLYNYKIMIFFSFSFRSIVNEGPNEFLSVRAPLYLAGVPEQTGTKAWKQWHLRNTTSFIGESYFLSFVQKSKKFVKSKY